MSEVNPIPDPSYSAATNATAQILPLVYDELRKLAAAQMARERDGHTLDATALVHEAFLRLGGDRSFASKSAFLRAAAEAMRRILVDHARAKRAEKRGGEWNRIDLPDVPAALPHEDLLALDEALTELERHDSIAAELVKLRYFSGFSHSDAAAALDLTRRQADGIWAAARIWLFRRLQTG